MADFLQNEVYAKSCVVLHNVFPQPTADSWPDASSRVQKGWRESLPSTTSSTSRASNRDPEDDWSMKENWNHAFHQGRQKVVNREEPGKNIRGLRLETTDLETTNTGTSPECHVSSVGIAWFNRSFGAAISFPFFRKPLKNISSISSSSKSSKNLLNWLCWEVLSLYPWDLIISTWLPQIQKKY